MAGREKYSIDYTPDPAGTIIIGGKPWKMEEAGDVNFGRNFKFPGNITPLEALLDQAKTIVQEEISEGVFETRYNEGKKIHTFCSDLISLSPPNPRLN